ncbi:MAG: citrate lyase acyl carrier protein [Chordicoccus sp.]|jgi:citrate lyase subunit gamma (acyl carrier protein)
MEITKHAVAGTMESSDCQVMIEPGDGKIDFSLDSTVINQYGNEIRHVVLDTLKRLGVDNAKVSVVDKGALDCTIKARVEGAVYRSVDQTEDLPWGGAIR